MGPKANLVETIAVGNELGECVLWRDSDQTLWWTDIQSCRLHRLTWPSMVLTVFETPQRLCAFSFLDGTDQAVLAAFESGLAIYSPEDEQITWLDRPHDLQGPLRLNDGRTAPDGRFWMGSMSEDMARTGKLYCTSKTGRLDTRHEGVHISNGICWAPDGRTMYFADSPSQKIRQCAYDTSSGTTKGWQEFASVSTGEPDGAITDAAGTYWFAHWGGARVAGITPHGNVIGEIDIPTPNPTCPALGGPNGNLMFVTTARQGLDKSHHASGAGDLYVFETDLSASPNAQSRAKLTRSDV